MQLKSIFAGRKSKYIGGLLILGSVALCCLAFSLGSKDDMNAARREILLRKIGHELLLKSGDSLSRVLPVKRLSDNQFQVSFENPFAFQPETLVEITRLVLEKDPQAGKYVVNVLQCEKKGVAYGFAISNDNTSDIVSCLGRTQPDACYILDFKFEPAGIISSRAGYLLGVLALFSLVGLILLRSGKPVKAPPAAPLPAGSFLLGNTHFDPEARQLTNSGTVTELTRTEARVLSIFAAAPNQPIERSRLQKEIWEDEGIIVGRSLDVFISKLRKKLEGDSSLRIAVIRGKGYRLEIGTHKE
ncbi:MAG: winged helix family transcriptional regulator [Chitinophagaceae bacterium]|nr:MAG: winged helix family transcriptional regulator [Chitinophagaceae bacterium]